MIDKFNRWLTERYVHSCGISSDFDKQRIEYSLKMVLDELEKIIGIIIIFIILNQGGEFIFSFIVLMSLRIFIGGIHFSTRGRCFLFTLLFFLASVYLSKVLIVDKIIGLLICVGAFLNIVLCAPLSSKHRILVTKGEKDKLKQFAIKVMIIWIIVYFFANKKMANIILWTVIMQQFEILYYTIFKKVAMTKNE